MRVNYLAKNEQENLQHWLIPQLLVDRKKKTAWYVLIGENAI